MVGKRDLRFAHTDGYTDIAFDETGDYIISAGNDGTVRIWKGYEDDSPSSHHMGNSVYALAHYGDTFYTSTDNNDVQSYSFPDGQSQGTISRFTSTVYAICCSQNGKFVAMGGGDFIVKVVELADSSLKQFDGHQAPILGIALDPEGEFVASSSCDGTVKIWNANTSDCIKSLNLLPKSNDFCTSRSLAKINFQPNNGQCLCVPVENGVQILKRDSWETLETLTDSHFEGALSIASFSPCGTYLAACDLKGKIVIWKFLQRTVLLRESHSDEDVICAMAWNPKKSTELLFSDNQGQFCMIDFEDSAPQNKPSSSSKTDELEIDDDNEPIFKSPVVNKKKSRIIDDDDDDDAIDLGAIKAEYEPKIFGSQEDETAKPAAPPAQVIVTQKVPMNNQQPAFIPSSTPEHFQHRFMLWNNIGIVSCYNTEEENTIDVEFHDTALHHQMHMSNNLNYNLAALSHEALLLSCRSLEDKCSKLYCVNFGSWDSNREWSIDLPEGEDVESIVVGAGWLACGTDNRFLRLFTVGGIQLNILSLPGPVVAMAASETMLAVVYHQSAGLSDDQHLVMSTYTITKNKMIPGPQQSLALSSKSTLVWFGFTDEGTICTADSKGIIRLYSKNSWVPILNTKGQSKGKSDHHFLIGLSQIQQQIRYIPCKGSKYPATLPRPVVGVMTFSLPFCDLNTDKGQLEESYCRTENLHTLLTKLSKEGYEVDDEMATAHKKIIENLMRLFALSTRSEREFRALEIGKLMPNARVVEGAIQYASQLHCMALAERLGEVASDMAEEPEEEEVEENDQLELPQVNAASAIRNRYSIGRNFEEDTIQPKPISITNRRSLYERHESLVASVQSDSAELSMDDLEEFEEKEAIDDGDTPAGSNLVTNDSNSQQKNPFKVSSQHRKSGAGIDGILKESVDHQKSKILSQKQEEANKKSQLEATAKKNKAEAAKGRTTVGYQLYFDENKADLIEEHPELDTAAISKLSVQNFKKLSSQEKKEWNEKGKAAAKAGTKRKSSVDNESSAKKAKGIGKDVSSNTLTKISSFMFAKKD